jgi:hypothetical protein
VEEEEIQKCNCMQEDDNGYGDIMAPEEQLVPCSNGRAYVGCGGEAS